MITNDQTDQTDWSALMSIPEPGGLTSGLLACLRVMLAFLTDDAETGRVISIGCFH